MLIVLLLFFQVSVMKARNTLLLHLLQLCFLMASTFHNVLIVIAYTALHSVPQSFTKIQIVLYILLILLPKCLSVLVYGLRDPKIRRVLLLHLVCRVHK